MNKLFISLMVVFLLILAIMTKEGPYNNNYSKAIEDVNEVEYTSSDSYVNELSRKLDELGREYERAPAYRKPNLENQLYETKEKLQEYLEQNPEIRNELFLNKDEIDWEKNDTSTKAY